MSVEQAGPAQRKGPGVGFKLAASFVVLLGFLGVAELVARAIGPQVPHLDTGETGEGTVLLNPHPTRLWWTAPGTKNAAGFDSTINELGLRGPMPEVPKPENLKRILVLGDSSLFGHGVPDDGTFPAQLQQTLTAMGLRVDVVNGGTPGYSTEQSLRLLDEVGWDLQPDLLIIGNLWSDNNFDSFQDADLLRTVDAFSNPLSHSAFYRLVAGWIDRARGGGGARIVSWTVDSQLPKQSGRRVPIGRYAENLSKMVTEAASRGVGAVFLALTNIHRVESPTQSGSWDAYFQTQRLVAQHFGLPVFDAETIFLGAGLSNPNDLFVDTMHPSVLGDQLLAESVANGLFSAGWPWSQTFVSSAGPFDGPVPEDPFIDGVPSQMTFGISPQMQLFKTSEDQEPQGETSPPSGMQGGGMQGGGMQGGGMQGGGMQGGGMQGGGMQGGQGARPPGG